MEEAKRESIKAAIEKAGNRLPPKVRLMAEETIMKIENGVRPMDALGFTPSMIEAIYKYAYDRFQAGKYKDALYVFNFLRQLDVSNYRYTFGIAACYQYRKEYSEAAANYIICRSLDPLNPISSFHLYECFMQLNHPLSAFQALSETIALAELNPHYDELKEKALLEYKTLKKGLKKYLKDNFDQENLNAESLNEKQGEK
jgi:type III secretion system low calcium response chaperone LcrH/SycD